MPFVVKTKRKLLKMKDGYKKAVTLSDIVESFEFLMYISENGMSCYNSISFDGKMHTGIKSALWNVYIRAMQ